MRQIEHMRAHPPKKQLQAMRRAEHLQAQPQKWQEESGASNKAGQTSASTTASEATARNATNSEYCYFLKRPLYEMPRSDMRQARGYAAK